MNKLHIVSDERLPSSSYSNAFYTSTEMLRQDIAEIGLSAIRLESDLPTINERNKILEFFSSISTLNHSVTLTEGYYTPTSLMAHIETQLNTLTGTSSLTFTISLVSGSVSTFTVSANANFKFIYTNIGGSHMYRSKSSSGLLLDVLASSQTVITKALYTSYIDILISSLKEGQHLQNLFSHNVRFSSFDHIYRSAVNTDVEIHNIHYSKVRKRRLTELNIILYDQYGDQLYDPLNSNYVSYILEISMA